MSRRRKSLTRQEVYGAQGDIGIRFRPRIPIEEPARAKAAEVLRRERLDTDTKRVVRLANPEEKQAIQVAEDFFKDVLSKKGRRLPKESVGIEIGLDEDTTAKRVGKQYIVETTRAAEHARDVEFLNREDRLFAKQMEKIERQKALQSLVVLDGFIKELEKPKPIPVREHLREGKEVRAYRRSRPGEIAPLPGERLNSILTRKKQDGE